MPGGSLSVMRWIRRLLRMSRDDRRLVATAYLRLGMVALSLRCLGFRRTVRVIPSMPSRPSRDVGDGDVSRAWRYADSIRVAARHQPIEARCLARSLALHWWLRCEGLPSLLRIGVAIRGAELGAHAWVELAGVPVNETPAEVARLTPLSDVEACVGRSRAVPRRRFNRLHRRGGPGAMRGEAVTCRR
jgi:hypothetical protein